MLSQDERQLRSRQPRCKEVGSRSRAHASRKEQRPRITSTQPQSVREGHRASDTWWNHLPYPGYMRLYNDHYSRTSSSQLCKVNGSTCLHLASSTCRDVTSLDRQRLHGSRSQPHIPHWVSNSGVVWALNLIVEGRVLSLPSSPDQRKECSLSFSPPPAGQSCLACALWLLVRRPCVLEQEGTRCR